MTRRIELLLQLLAVALQRRPNQPLAAILKRTLQLNFSGSDARLPTQVTRVDFGQGNHQPNARRNRPWQRLCLREICHRANLVKSADRWLRRYFGGSPG
jgi:hypothetical protein